MKNIQNEKMSASQGDWFHKAMTTPGSVKYCLDQVIDELDLRKQFTEMLKTLIVRNHSKGADQITFMGRRVKIFEDTIKLRLSLLSKDRTQSWFRCSVSQTTGPFSTVLLIEPVFPQFELDQIPEFKIKLQYTWDQCKQLVGSHSEFSNSLWGMLLEMNFELEELCKFTYPFEGLRLDQLPDQLPDYLKCPNLERFLFNVKKELLSVRRKLELCKDALWKICEPFWEYHVEIESKKQSEWQRTYVNNDVADKMREEFKRRRQENRRFQQTSNIFNLEREYLHFMGFSTIPSKAELKKRYILLAKKLHPDCEGGDANKFQKLADAFKHLGDKYHFL